MVDRAAQALYERAALADTLPVVADVSREADVDSYVEQAVGCLAPSDEASDVSGSTHLIDAAVNA